MHVVGGVGIARTRGRRSVQSVDDSAVEWLRPGRRVHMELRQWPADDSAYG